MEGGNTESDDEMVRRMLDGEEQTRATQTAATQCIPYYTDLLDESFKQPYKHTRDHTGQNGEVYISKSYASPHNLGIFHDTANANLFQLRQYDPLAYKTPRAPITIEHDLYSQHHELCMEDWDVVFTEQPPEDYDQPLDKGKERFDTITATKRDPKTGRSKVFTRSERNRAPPGGDAGQIDFAWEHREETSRGIETYAGTGASRPEADSWTVTPGPHGHLRKQMWWRGHSVVSMQEPTLEKFEDMASEDAGWQHLDPVGDYAEELKGGGT